MFPEGLQGRTVLDCASEDGAALRWAQERGAGRCLGLDEPEDIEALLAGGERRFDITLFRGLFHRLPDPITALHAAGELTEEVLLLETPTRAGTRDHFLALEESGSENGAEGPIAWLPTGPGALQRLLRSAGFIESRVVEDEAPAGGVGRISIVASKRTGVVAPASKVTRGKDGWLFLSDDTNQVLQQHAGELRFSAGDLRRWQGTLESRIERLGEMGIPYHYLVVPNKESVYEEHLPDDLPRAAERPVHQLMNHLASEGSPVSIVYPEPQMSVEKDRWPLFPKTDTHWSGLGAFIAYRTLAGAIGTDVPMHVVQLGDLEFMRWVEVADLGEKLTPPEPAVKVVVRVRGYKTRLAYDNRVRNTGRVLAFERKDLEGSRCVLFGDSFAWNLLPYLAESFSRFVFVHRPTLDYEVIERERPDLVLSATIERFLIAVPDDLKAPSTAELEERKRLRDEILSDDEALGYARMFDPEFRPVVFRWSTDLEAVVASVEEDPSRQPPAGAR